MSLGLAFWVLMLVWLVFGFFGERLGPWQHCGAKDLCARVATGSTEIQNHIHMAISGIFFLRKILQDVALDLLDRAMRPHMREPV